MNYLTLLSTVVGGGEAATQASGGSGGGLFGGLFSGGSSIAVIAAYCALIFGVMWLMSRPQKKREKELKALQDSLKPGDDIMMHSGLFGTIIEAYDATCLVEFGTNKSVRVPVLRSAIAGVKSPDLSVGKVEEKS